MSLARDCESHLVFAQDENETIRFRQHVSVYNVCKIREHHPASSNHKMQICFQLNRMLVFGVSEFRLNNSCLFQFAHTAAQAN